MEYRSGGRTTAALVFGGSNTGPAKGSNRILGWIFLDRSNDLATARHQLGGQQEEQANFSFSCRWNLIPENHNSNRRMVFLRFRPPTTPAADYADAITGDFYYNSTTGQFKTVNMAERLLELGQVVEI